MIWVADLVPRVRVELTSEVFQTTAVTTLATSARRRRKPKGLPARQIRRKDTYRYSMYQKSELIKNYTTSLRERLQEIKDKWIAASSKYNDSLHAFEEIRHDIYLLYINEGLSLRKIAAEFNVDHTRIKQIIASVRKKLSEQKGGGSA